MSMKRTWAISRVRFEPESAGGSGMDDAVVRGLADHLWRILRGRNWQVNERRDRGVQRQTRCRRGLDQRPRFSRRQPPMKEKIPTTTTVAIPAQRAGPWTPSRDAVSKKWCTACPRCNVVSRTAMPLTMLSIRMVTNILGSYSERTRSRRLGENVLVLAITDDQHPFPGAFTLHEFKPVVGGIDGDERDRAIVILSRCYRALPLAEIECGYAALAQHLKLTQFLAVIALCQSRHERLIGRHHESFPFFRQGCFMACCLGGNIAGRLEFSVEDHFKQATPEWTQQHSPSIRISEQHGANAGVGQKVNVGLKTRHAAAVMHHRDAVGSVNYQAHPITLIFAEGNLRRPAHQQIF